MDDTTLLADHIDREIDSILSLWRATVERYGKVPTAGRLSQREFVDRIPELLEQLASRLRGEHVDLDESSQKHGQHRWSQGYDVSEVVAELGHLRSTLLRDVFHFARTHRYDIALIEETVAAVDAVIDEAMATSVRQFQEDSQEMNRAVLDEFEFRKEAAESERLRTQTVLDNLPVGVWVADAEGNLVGVNPAAERLQGFAEAETVGRVNALDRDGMPGFRLADGSECPPEARPINRALGGETVIQQDLLCTTRGEPSWVSANAAPLSDGEGRPSGAVMVIQDISDRKRLAADLAISEARFRGIVAKSPVMIWRADPSGSCDFFNETWLEFRGRSEAEEAGRGWADGVHPDDLDRCLETRASALERRETFEIVYRLLHADGRHRWVTERGVPYHDAAGTFLGFLGSCLDITARIELEGKLEQQSQHKSRLMAALSHDARTPLNAVVLSARLLESQVKDLDDPEVRDSLTTIRNAVRNVLDLLSDLLDLSRIDAGATMAETSRFDLQATLAECLSSIEPQARAKGLEVALDEDCLQGVRLDTDRAKLKQILSNFLSNALNYTERGKIRLYLDQRKGQVRIGVEDTGVGIAPEDQQRIFDEFAVLEHPNRLRGEGTGLGLAICRRLANLLHGEILLESSPGRGSRFILALPESVLTRESVAEAPPAAAPDRNFAGSILIAEDHADSRKTLAKVLRRIGYRVQEAGDGHEVIDLVRQERPMLILMDVNMPGLDGVETTLALRKDPRFRDLTIFALTGDVSVLNQQRIGEAGVDGYLEKPVTWEKLETVLTQLQPPLKPTKG